MCGRYLILTEDEIIEYRQIINEVNERYKETPLLASMATGEIFPSHIAPVLVKQGSGHRAALMKWGFPLHKGLIINARAETALEKKMFHTPLLKRRCVIPTNGFFEWRQEEKKTKYLFRPPQTRMLYLAGFFDSFTTEKPYHAYTILTTEANTSVASYHTRMPLVLGADQLNAWLSDTAFALQYIHQPCAAMLEASAV